MKFWDEILCEDLPHKKASVMVKNTSGYAFTRKEWSGVHFYNENGEYCILFADGHIEVDMLDKAWDKDKTDWMIVTLTSEAEKLLKETTFTKAKKV